MGLTVPQRIRIAMKRHPSLVLYCMYMTHIPILGSVTAYRYIFTHPEVRHSMHDKEPWNKFSDKRYRFWDFRRPPPELVRPEF